MRALIAFRVDSGQTIGQGHLSRCLTLAHAMRKYGIESVFVCRPRELSVEQLAADAGFKVCILPNCRSPYVPPAEFIHGNFLECSQTEDAALTREILKEHPEIKTIIVDHYGIGAEWDEVLYKDYRILKIDDLADRKHKCHGLIDSNLYLNYKTRYEGLLSDKVLTMLGPEFAILKDTFSNLDLDHRNKASEIRKVLVNFGGHDLYGYCYLIAKDLLYFQNYEVIVVGSVSENLKDEWSILKDKFHDRLHLTGFISDPSQSLRQAELYIGAGGTITWERFACGLPGIVYSIAKNQVRLAEDLAKQGLQVYAGDISNYSYDSLSVCLSSISNAEHRKSLALRMAKLVDGLGVHRIIKGWHLSD